VKPLNFALINGERGGGVGRVSTKSKKWDIAKSKKDKGFTRA